MESFLANCAAPGAPAAFMAQSPEAAELGESLAEGAALTQVMGGDARIHRAKYVVQGRKTLGGSTTH